MFLICDVFIFLNAPNFVWISNVNLQTKRDILSHRPTDYSCSESCHAAAFLHNAINLINSKRSEISVCTQWHARGGTLRRDCIGWTHVASTCDEMRSVATQVIALRKSTSSFRQRSHAAWTERLAIRIGAINVRIPFLLVLHVARQSAIAYSPRLHFVESIHFEILCSLYKVNKWNNGY